MFVQVETMPDSYIQFDKINWCDAESFANNLRVGFADKELYIFDSFLGWRDKLDGVQCDRVMPLHEVVEVRVIR